MLVLWSMAEGQREAGACQLEGKNGTHQLYKADRGSRVSQ